MKQELVAYADDINKEQIQRFAEKDNFGKWAKLDPVDPARKSTSIVSRLL